jgi:hypothetical protein
MASTASSRTFESWTFAALRTTASGTPRWSATTWRFEPAFSLSVGFGLVLCPPLFAVTLAESRETLSQSIRSASPRRSRSTRCSASHTPASCQSRKCRQHVEPDPQPISPWGASPRGCAALQDEDDASEGRAIVDTRSAALWFGWLFGQQRLDRILQFVRYQFFAHINERNICPQAGFARCSKVSADDPVWVRSSWCLIYSHMVI